MATLTTNQAGASADYLRYCYGDCTKTDAVNAPTLLDFRVSPFDSNFVKLVRGAYITLTTSTYGVWYTGFITNDAELEYLGTTNVNGVVTPIWGYVYQASGDQYLLNLKPLGIVPPFVNTTQGEILRTLIDNLSPAGWSFDVTGVQNGISVSRYIVDPNKHFYDIVKELADGSNFQFQIINKQVTFRPQDTIPAGISVDGSSKHFTPSVLTVKPNTDPIVNDVIVLGDIEPQGYMNEYFAGDGITASFPLAFSVYGVDSTLLLDDDFSGSTIDTTKWTLDDAPQGYIQPINGFLNVLGGPNDGQFNILLQSQSLLPLEGNLRMTHGEYDFVSASDGIVGGLWSNDPLSNLSNCLYGIRAQKSGAATTLSPLINGVVDSTQTMTIDYTKRYILRTLFVSKQAIRHFADYAYRTVDGVVGRIGGSAGQTDTCEYQTIITEIDPTTGLLTNRWNFLNTNVSLTANQSFAYYCPVVTNDLHCSLTGITISNPMQTSLETKVKGTLTYLPQLMGPNEIDSFDGYAPQATIVDSNGGTTSKSTILGSPTFNPGQATLTYFKSTVQQTSTTPPIGSLNHVSYRRPGAAIARVQDRSSLMLEAAAFKDDGLRTAVRSDLSPLPRSQRDAEYAASAILKDNSYQHYDGTYAMPSGPWFSSEPVSGTILKFVNLTSAFPAASLKAEAITEVVTNLLHITNKEQFLHTITFGRINLEARMLASLPNLIDVFVPQDTAEIPNYVDINSVGISHALDITAPKLVSLDSNNFYFDAGLTLPTGSVLEVRATDESWGADAGKNLLGRFNSNLFSIPRNTRGKYIFMKLHDTRNYVTYSENLTAANWNSNGGVTPPVGVSLVTAKNPDNHYSRISKVHLAANYSNNVYQNTGYGAVEGQQVVVSCNILGPAGAIVSFGLNTYNVQLFTCTGYWQRISVSTVVHLNGTPSYYTIFSTPSSTDIDLQITRVSLEVNTLVETVYCKTNDTTYGALSRYSAGIHVGLPLIPPAPTATLTFTSDLQPVVTVNLPTVLSDVWGIQIKDNVTNAIVESQDLTSVGYNPVLELPSNNTRSFSYNVYTYNLLGELSAPYVVSYSLPVPAIQELLIVDKTKLLEWDSTNSTGFRVQIDDTSAAMNHVIVDQTVTDNFFSLSDADFFGTRWFTVTPFDAGGNGSPIIAEHLYLPDAVIELNGNEVVAVALPTSYQGAVVVPSTFAAYTNDYNTLAYTTYTRTVSGL